MAWGRLALIQAAGEREEALQQTAAIFGYEALPQIDALHEDNISGESKQVKDFVAGAEPEQGAHAVAKVSSRALNIPKYLISIINILIYAVQIDQKMLK